MRSRRSAAIAIVVIGVGMGGFVDGILLHQILQWHNMLSNVYPPENMQNMRINMLWDGLFHAAVWVVTLVGATMLWRAARRGDPMPGGRAFIGALFVGWALFNLVEGIVDHEILEIHYVYPGPWHTVANMTFLGLSALLLVIGGWMMRARTRPSPFRERR